MKAIILLTLLSISLCYNPEFINKVESPLITHEYLQNKKETSNFEMFTYEEHPFKDWTPSELKSLLGLSQFSLKDTQNVVYNIQNTSDLPEAFDARERWPECIHPIRDQGKCGSCWAHAASEVLSDRFCIASNGQVNLVLSPQDMVSCDYLDHGCNGGILTASWIYLRFFGIVSESCKPYTSGQGVVESCPLFTKNCKNNEQYRKFKASNFYALSAIDDIKRSLYENGPVETGFSVYDDFTSYKNGIYKRSPNASFLGGHAVKIIGWGSENGQEYWIVANSWSEKWGESGYFRIAFRECGIENCIAGDPQL